MTKLVAKLQARQSDKGATAVEYGLMVALIAIVIIVAVSALGTNLSTLFTAPRRRSERRPLGVRA